MKFLKKGISEKVYEYYQKTLRKSQEHLKKVRLQKSAFKNNLLKYQNDIKDFWNIINKVIRKRKVNSPFPNKIIVDNLGIADTLLISEN